MVFHEDLTNEDMEGLQAVTPAKLFFQKVSFGEENLPPYLDREAYLSWIKPMVSEK